MAKIVRVADYPGYLNVYELNDKDLIDLKMPYHLFTAQNKVGSKIIITEALEVSYFDDSM